MPTETAEVITARQFKIKQSRLVGGWLRSEFIKCRLKVSRQTAYLWDLALVESVDDYTQDPNTGETLWQAGKPWNAHQMWALLKVKQWMARSPKPLLEDLKNYLVNNQHQFTHQQFFKEYFNYDAQRTR